MQNNKFKTVNSKQDFIKMEHEILESWKKDAIVEKYLKKNQNSDQKFSFLDGPITANNPMGVHHAWGRTYKDLWQRFYNMKGYAGRFQNGFDEQGLWVEVEVEKELGFKNKKDIEKFGIDKFVNLCKERVKKYSDIQTEQSRRLAYFMDWENSYHTSSDTNNYKIWNFLKVCNEKGYLYKGHDTVPWCPRCGTAISQHEILTEQYVEVTHKSVYFKLQIKDRKNEYLLVWTTTPWTIPGNVAVAVDPDETYVTFKGDGEDKLWVMEKRLAALGEGEPIDKKRGKELVGWEYIAPFDDLEGIEKSLGVYNHRVIATDKQILPISEVDGTGLVHLAPGAGAEDFALGKKEKIPVIELIDEEANYVSGMGKFSGENAKKNPDLIISYLEEKENGKFIFKTEKYKHRYPTCWRCKTELVWRVVDEWYIAMDKIPADKSSTKTLREQMVDVAKEIKWLPKFGLDRELDWLKNMHDWLISKKRYWGLALPIWECAKCGNFEVIGSKEELKKHAVEGWDKFEGNSPHRPWIDNVKIKCTKCNSTTSRILDVGNPWLDAGIVPFSTLPEGWFPADFITESFPGQFKNWFYSLIAMSTVLKNSIPTKTILGFATLLDEHGREMHKSAGNAIEFNVAADKIGVDIIRWMYAFQNPSANLLFGYHKGDEVRRRFYLILWNSYKFFTDYANLAQWVCEKTPTDITKRLTTLDKWILASLTELVLAVNKSLTAYDAQTAARLIEEFVVNDLSTWFIRRSRDRVGPNADTKDQDIFLSTFYGVLVTISKISAPFMPFISEEIYKNLTGDESVHLSNYPQGDKSLLDEKLIADMKIVRQLVEGAHSIRKEQNIKVRQPLAEFTYGETQLDSDLEKLIAAEINVKKIIYKKGAKPTLDTKLNEELITEGEAREIIRLIQGARKEAGCDLSETVSVKIPNWPKKFENDIKKQTLVSELIKSDSLEIVRG